MLHLDPRRVLLRSLNFFRKSDPAGYVGLRFMANVRNSSRYYDWLADYLNRQVVASVPASYRDYAELKGLDRRGLPIFRTMTGASPTSMMLETCLLDIVIRHQVYEPPVCVYSYRWPDELEKNQLFGYFLRYYLQRDADIRAALGKVDDAVAIVVDIEQFYPSAKIETAGGRLQALLEGCGMPEQEAQFALRLSGLLLDGLPGDGIPIGPPIGHLLGQLALSKVDELCMTEYPNRYFRYVDDIVIVTERSNGNVALGRIEEIMHQEGFSLNPGKTDILAGSEWRTGEEYDVVSEQLDPFQRLIRGLTAFLSIYPKSYHELRTRLVEEGCCLPLRNLRAVSTTGRFRRFLLMSKWRLRPILYSKIRDVDSLVGSVREIREHYRELCRRIVQNDPPADGMSRRWYVQSARYAFNRLLYLRGLSIGDPEFEAIPEVPELFQLRTLVSALQRRDCTPLVGLPSVATRTFAAIAGEYFQEQVTVDWEAVHSNWNRDGVAPLLLQGVVRLPESVKSNLPILDYEFLRFCEGAETSVRALTDHSVVDELRTLQLGQDRTSIEEFLSTRFDDDEDVALDGLLLDAGGYLS